MNIDWNAFTPWASLGGGLLIGLASALYLLGNGRVAGIAGIVASPLRAVLGGGSLAPERARLLFILGLLVAPWVSVSAASTARSKWRGPCARPCLFHHKQANQVGKLIARPGCVRNQRRRVICVCSSSEPDMRKLFAPLLPAWFSPRGAL
jgi:hypothetical protein